MRKYSLILPGRPATKKNSATLIKNRAIVLPSASYLRYEKSCRKVLENIRQNTGLPHFTMPVRMTCWYYLDSKAHWPDLTGLMQATADILSDQKERRNRSGEIKTPAMRWLLSDDRIITSWNGSKIAGIDKYNPRTEIEIAELEVDLETAMDPYIIKQLRADREQQLF